MYRSIYNPRRHGIDANRCQFHCQSPTQPFDRTIDRRDYRTTRYRLLAPDTGEEGYGAACTYPRRAIPCSVVLAPKLAVKGSPCFCCVQGKEWSHGSLIPRGREVIEFTHFVKECFYRGFVHHINCQGLNVPLYLCLGFLQFFL